MLRGRAVLSVFLTGGGGGKGEGRGWVYMRAFRSIGTGCKVDGKERRQN
jgi:hypothetical protein